MADSRLPLDVIKQLVSYDPATGRFYRLGWRYHGRRFFAFDESREVAGTNGHGYVQLRLEGETVLGHRLAWFMVHGEWPDTIDHINGNKADNRIANLRNCTQADNCQNIRAPKSHNSTGFLGVSFDKGRGKFVAAFGIGGKRKVIGRFDSAEEAHQRYLEAKREHHAFATV